MCYDTIQKGRTNVVYMFFNLNIVMIRYFALTSQYIALTRILDTTKHEQNNYTHINIYNTEKDKQFFYEERTKGYASRRHRTKSCVLFTYL